MEEGEQNQNVSQARVDGGGFSNHILLGLREHEL
jgi:hypothetical protein